MCKSIARWIRPPPACEAGYDGAMDISITNVHLDLGAGRRRTDMGPSAMHVAGLVPKLRALGHHIVDSCSIAARNFEDADTGDPRARFL